MADPTTPSTPPRRRVVSAQPATPEPPEPPSDGPRGPESYSDVSEDRTRFGWPGVYRSPFCPVSYYDQFPERFRPRFDVASGQENLTREDVQKMDAGWQRPIPHITLLLLSHVEDQIMILGETPGEKMWVTIPPFGVVRGPLQTYLNTGLAGSQYSKYVEIGPSAAALLEPHGSSEEDARRRAEVQRLCTMPQTDPLINGARLPKCGLYGCPVDGHSNRLPNGELEMLLGLMHACYYIESIGQTLTTKNPATGVKEVVYTPDYRPSELDRFGPETQLNNYLARDNRVAVHLYAAERKTILLRRERENRNAAAEGRMRTGR